MNEHPRSKLAPWVCAAIGAGFGLFAALVFLFDSINIESPILKVIFLACGGFIGGFLGFLLGKKLANNRWVRLVSLGFLGYLLSFGLATACLGHNHNLHPVFRFVYAPLGLFCAVPVFKEALQSYEMFGMWVNEHIHPR